jgi:NAD(P)-dependent dehydrogenase (short-subunit alcohol dehydrogenase family)
MLDGLVPPGGSRAATEAALAAQMPLGRILTPREVAMAAVYLASEESAMMTGAELRLDGGYTAR